MKAHLLLHFRLNLVKQLQKSGKNKEIKTSKTSMKKTRSNVDVGESRGYGVGD